MRHVLIFGMGVMGFGLFAVPANAATVTISGTILNQCVLTPVGGAMVADSTGTVMTTESGVGAAPATLAVVATGSVPTLTFGAPTLSGPATGSTTQIRYTGSGASQPFTATSSTASAARLDTFTVHAKVDNSAGFPSGVYTVSTIVTCGQP